MFAFAFTLAEVLIVLGIIGLIADMTIPTLHQQIDEKVTVVRLKKAYSTFESAYKLAIVEEGSPEDWGNREETFNKIKKHLKLLKDCSIEKQGCWADKLYMLHGTYYLNIDTSVYPRAQLADGTSIAIEGANGYGILRIDINGLKKPNTMGIDTFFFYYYPDKVFPIGATKGNLNEGDDFTCSMKNTNQHNGIGCTAWVIYNENLDYLHCDDLSWEGSHYCK